MFPVYKNIEERKVLTKVLREMIKLFVWWSYQVPKLLKCLVDRVLRVNGPKVQLCAY